MKTNKKTDLFRAIRLIKKAFAINCSIPKGYGTRSADYEFFYTQKARILYTAIEIIKSNSLSIKYGVQNGILYFNIGKDQFSFHGYWMGIKEYNGEWIGTRNPASVCHMKNRRGETKLPLAKDKLCEEESWFILNSL